MRPCAEQHSQRSNVNSQSLWLRSFCFSAYLLDPNDLTLQETRVHAAPQRIQPVPGRRLSARNAAG